MDKMTLIVISVASLASIITLGFAAYTYRRGQRAKSWPNTQGVVDRSGVTQRDSKSSDGTISISHFPDVAYSYSVNGAPQSNTRIVVGAFRSYSQSSAQEVAARYPVGAKVTVYYDPEDPSYGILETGAPWVTVLSFLVAALFSASLAFFFYYYTIPMRK